MTPHTLRRAALGLTIHGPFSRNRRRRREIREAGPFFLAAGLLIGLGMFLAALFTP